MIDSVGEKRLIVILGTHLPQDEFWFSCVLSYLSKIRYIGLSIRHTFLSQSPSKANPKTVKAWLRNIRLHPAIIAFQYSFYKEHNK